MPSGQIQATLPRVMALQAVLKRITEWNICTNMLDESLPFIVKATRGNKGYSGKDTGDRGPGFDKSALCSCYNMSKP